MFMLRGTELVVQLHRKFLLMTELDVVTKWWINELESSIVGTRNKVSLILKLTSSVRH
jgi:hypothetical protein